MGIFKFNLFFILVSAFFYSQSEMPIMAFHSFTPETSTLANFKKFKQAGFNINHTVFKTNDQAQSALDLAQKSGIKMMIYTDELINDTDKTVRRFKNHPALFGYFLADEPSPENFPALKVLVSKIKKDKPVITCCASGMRSAQGKGILKSSGFAEVHNGGGWMSLNNKIR